MNQTQASLAELLSINRRHQEYAVAEYIAYCERIRTAIEGLPEGFDDRKVINFFEKDFVEEMEVLARICKHQFHGSYAGISVQYMRPDPPDGIITRATGEKIYVECTSAVDRRWENFALEQYRRHGKIVSLSGFEGGDIEGNRVAGYSVKGMNVNDPAMAEYLVEAEEDQEIISRHRRHITEKLEKKLQRTWEPRTNWLCIFVNEFMLPGGYRLMEPVLNDICFEYSNRLRENYIAALYFVGNRCDDSGWMTFHPS